MRVKCTITIDRETAKALRSEISNGKNLYTVIPRSTEMICPPIKLRGCDNFTWGTPYINTAEAPNEPTRKIVSDAFPKMYWLRTVMR